MQITETTDTRRTPADQVTVQMNLRVPYFYREQLIAEAQRRGMSINRLLVNLLVAGFPPVDSE
jgi:predicted HicB family RNase H-like nuclease